jgi:hypothetical protein
MNPKPCFWGMTAAALAGVLIAISWPSRSADPSVAQSDLAGWLRSFFCGPGPPAIGELGRVVNGEWEEGEPFVWMARSKDDLVSLDPQVLLYGQIIRSPNEFADEVPLSQFGRVECIAEDGTLIGPGVTLCFVLVSSSPSGHVYRSQRPLLLIDNLELQGEYPEAVAVYAEPDCYVRVVEP